MLKIETFVNRPIDENTYVVSDETGEAVIVDCGAITPDDQQAIGQYIEREGLIVRHHVLTHGHFDHMFGAQWVVDTYGCHPLVHADDEPIYRSAVTMVSAFFHRRMEFPVPTVGGHYSDGDVIAFGSHSLRAIHTPGHTPGGCCLYCESEGVLLSGDSIFQGSIGRTDMVGGSHEALVESLVSKVLTLPAGVRILPGHGPATTVERELAFNPYLPKNER